MNAQTQEAYNTFVKLLKQEALESKDTSDIDAVLDDVYRLQVEVEIAIDKLR